VRLSIRWRLTLWNALALAVGLLGFAVLVYGLLARALYQQTDRGLEAGWRLLAQDERLPEDPDGRLRHWVDEYAEHERLFCIVYGADGRVRLKTNELAAGSVPPAPRDGTDGPRFYDATVPPLGRQRVLEARLRLGDQENTVLLMTSLAEVERELGQLLAVLLLTVPVALAVSAGLGYLLARKALAPVEQLRRRTQEVTADRLDRRLPVANPADELGTLAGTINDMIGRLERSFAEVRRFTADASHELRTPLTAIRTETEVALGKPSVPAEQRQLLGSILEECDRLTRLTDQLLTLAREEAGAAAAAKEVELAALVGGVVETLRPLAEAKGLRLHAADRGPVSVLGDGARLRQVFCNALDNAIKYTPQGGAIDVHTEARAPDAVVTIVDTGEGIAPEHLPRVFDRFYRVDKARARELGGTGLGLSIARSIVAAHGGHIELTSTPGQGTTCTVALPLARAARPSRPAHGRCSDLHGAVEK
jgi:two-component system heavy metal sensor histidine kinase CusS